MNVSEAVTTRRSIRAFIDKPVDMDMLRQLIALAGRAPSGGNLQPWAIHVVSGAAMTSLKAIMRARLAEAPFGDPPDYAVYPQPLGEPYRTRRFEVGEAMYERLGIPREDKAARLAWFADNWQFFGAPVGLFLSVRRDHGPPQWSDCGMFLQTLMLLLREAGLDSCAQEAWSLHHRTVGDFLALAPEQMLFTGMAIGWRDPDASVNQFEVRRAPLEEWATFLA
jgi:nitroreductase